MQTQESTVVSGGLSQFRTRRGLGRVVGGLAALGAIAAAVGGDEAAGKKKKKRARSGTQGPAGPAGPAGPSGPTGPAGAPVTFSTAVGERSPVLAAALGAQVESVAECGVGSIPLSCGWFYTDEKSALDRTVTQVQPGFFRGSGRCRVTMRRTATVGAAGGQVTATAICTV
jgi:hypothetical protein